MNSTQRAAKAAELQALCMWRGAVGMGIGSADPIYEAVRKRANRLAEELSKPTHRTTCRLFPKLEGVVGIRLYEVVGRKRTQLRHNLSPLATKNGIEHIHGSDKQYYVQAFGADGRMLGGRLL